MRLGGQFSAGDNMHDSKSTPPAIVNKLNTPLKAALKDSDLVKRQEALDISVMTASRLEPATHCKFVETEVHRWSAAIKAAGQYADYAVARVSRALRFC
jgi:tripartite-type tricarboxylate transporter receptor subunit TctC